MCCIGITNTEKRFVFCPHEFISAYRFRKRFNISLIIVIFFLFLRRIIMDVALRILTSWQLCNVQHVLSSISIFYALFLFIVQMCAAMQITQCIMTIIQKQVLLASLFFYLRKKNQTKKNREVINNHIKLYKTKAGYDIIKYKTHRLAVWDFKKKIFFSGLAYKKIIIK